MVGHVLLSAHGNTRAPPIIHTLLAPGQVPHVGRKWMKWCSLASVWAPEELGQEEVFTWTEAEIHRLRLTLIDLHLKWPNWGLGMSWVEDIEWLRTEDIRLGLTQWCKGKRTNKETPDWGHSYSSHCQDMGRFASRLRLLVGCILIIQCLSVIVSLFAVFTLDFFCIHLIRT